MCFLNLRKMCLNAARCGAVFMLTGLCGCGGSDAGEPAVMNMTDAAESSYEGEAAQEEDMNGAQDTETAAGEAQAEETPVLRDRMRENIGCFAGCEVTGRELDDPKVWEIITTHFERVTLGNELKPDSLFGYSNARCPGKEWAEIGGSQIEVPKLDFSRPEKALDRFLEWNAEHPDREIKIRGHVLVWHSQTPEWFFHEGYDKSSPYVSADEMDKRLEWYIKTVLEHFTGEDSRYKDLFYGWDVVNEAVSDATGTYRSECERPEESLDNDTHGSNSSWWAVYKSERYILNAFKYANRYAPAELELYYNDYNECDSNKRNGIIKLLEAVKAEDGTRIDAMGMQGHYQADNPNPTAIQGSILAYAAVVGKVQLTELDVTAGSDYDGSAESKEAEYEKNRKRYSAIRFAIDCANDSADCEVSGVTWWGTVDHYSWLQNRSDVGGGSTKSRPQCPLLFGDDYEAKPCFYEFTR